MTYSDKIDAMYAAELAPGLDYPLSSAAYTSVVWESRQNIEDKRNTERLVIYSNRRYGRSCVPQSPEGVIFRYLPASAASRSWYGL